MTGSSARPPPSTLPCGRPTATSPAERGWVVVDGAGARDEVAARVWAAVMEDRT